MRLLLLLSLFIAFISCNKTEQITWVSISDDVKELAHDSYEGRATGTEGEQKAAAYIKQRFQQLNLSAKGTDGFEQRFSFKPSSNPHEKPNFSDSVTPDMTTARNVIGFIDNQAENTVVIGAHYDHLGYGMQGSLFDGKDSIHNGADDNASGVALMLNLAYRLQTTDSLSANNYLFIAFSGEEMGLLGSNYFVKNPSIDLSTVNYMINLDMVGRLNEDKTISISGVGTSPVFSQSLNAVNDFGLKLVEKESGVGPSDHTSFYLNDIPVLHFFTGQHADYHKPSDDAHLVNYEGMDLLSDYIMALIEDLNAQNKLSFRTTKNESEETPRFKVGLGVIPDYLFDGEGMRIDGISEDKPAQRAGLQKGDVVKQIDTMPVVDMMSYMKALSVFEAGQQTTIVIERNNQRLEVEVEF